MVFRAQQFILVVALMALAIFGRADSARGYALAGSQWPQPGGPGTPITLTYSYQNMFDGGMRGPGAIPDANGVFQANGPPLPNDLIRHSIEQALGLWASVAPVNFVEVPDQGGPIPNGDYPNGQFGQIRFRHRYINGTDPAVGDPIAKAQAYYPSTVGNIAGDVEFDDSDPWQAVGTTHIPDILGAATHEIGHTLGLGHSDIPGAVMYWIFHRFNGLGTGFLTPDDIAGMQSISGAGQGSVMPMAVPEPATWVLAGAGMTLYVLRRCHR